MEKTMAKTKFLVFAALCFTFLGVSHAVTEFMVDGRVYCDTCRAGFETNVTEYISGATVKLECRHLNTNLVEFSATAVTDDSGTYKVKVEQDHDEDICEVALVKSTTEGCTEKGIGRDRARIVLTQNSGIVSSLRHANSLGFFKDEPLTICGKLLQQYALGTYDNN